VTYLDGPRPRLFAHRGGSGIVPENTLEAFAEGLRAGADRLELDVHASADGHVVVFHDETLDRTTDGSGLLRRRTLAELRILDAGHRFVDASGGHPWQGRGLRIPTLDEVLEAFPGVPLNIEVKQDEPAIERAVVEVLDRHRARDRVLLAAFEGPLLTRVRAAAPDVPSGTSAEEVTAFVMSCLSGSWEGYVATPGHAFQVPPSHEGIDIVTEDFVREAHRAGKEVHVWTINDEAEMERLLDLGVDGLMTDVPALALAVFRRRGLRP
jgi:glycerophosphoryl diester phosphodiesterase